MNNDHQRMLQMRRSVQELEAYEKMVAEIEARDAFDLRNGTDTQSPVEVYHMDGLDITDDILKNNRRYSPTPIRTIEQILSNISVPYNSSGFVDFGAGKGRVALVASRLPWRRVIGVEASSELCAIARRNALIYSAQHGCASVVEIQCVDAIAFSIPPDAAVFYFFDPFSEEILLKVISNINLSLQAYPRRAYCVLVGRRLRGVFDKSNFYPIKQVESPDNPNFDCSIYSNLEDSCYDGQSITLG